MEHGRPAGKRYESLDSVLRRAEETEQLSSGQSAKLPSNEVEQRAPLPTGLRQRTVRSFGGSGSRRWRVGAIGAAVMAVLVGTLSNAWAAPERVLQDVQVKLAGDGSVSDIKSVVIRRSGDDEASSDENSMDPAEWGSKLPVRIQTTYQLGDKAGTNLKDINGESGTAVIEVTIQNLTAKAEEVVAGSPQQALVGTPMTVVAAANLGKSGLNQVVTKRATEGPITNGVVGSESGDDVVQWATLLVPPKLSPTATFRLVVSGKKLRVPEFNISVQPRLITDTSTGELLKSAFDPNRKTSTVALQRDTVDLVGRVNEALDLAGQNLEAIRTQLNDSAGTLGRQTYRDLLNSTSNLETQMDDVGKDLEQTQRSLGQSLNQTQSSLTASLSSAVGDMKKALGDPSRTTEPTGSNLTGTCVKTSTWSYPGVAPQSLSVYQHVLVAERTLEELTTAGKECADQVLSSLQTSIDESTNAVDDAKTNVTATFASITGTLDDIEDLYDAQWLEALIEDLDTLEADFLGNDGTIADDVSAIGDADGGKVEDVRDDLDDIEALIGPIQTALNGLNLDDVFDTLDDAKAKAQSPDLTLVADLIDEFCNESGETVVQDIAAAAGLDLGQCNDDLDGALDDAFGEIVTIIDGAPSRASVDDAIADLLAALTTLANDVDAAQQALDDHTDGLSTALSTLISDIEDLSDLAGEIAAASADAQTEVTQATSGVSDLKSNELPVWEGEQQQTLDDTNAVLAAARLAATANLGQLIDGLDQVQVQNATTRTRTRSAITASRVKLDAQAAAMTKTLGEGVTGAVNSMNAGLTASTKSIDDTRKQLLDDLDGVLVGIGSPSSRTGLIGVLEQNAQTTDEEAIKLDEANADARRFGNSQSAGHQQALLEWRQLDKALAQQNNFRPFGLNASPTNSLSVFSFTLGQE